MLLRLTFLIWYRYQYADWEINLILFRSNSRKNEQVNLNDKIMKF